MKHVLMKLPALGLAIVVLLSACGTPATPEPTPAPTSMPTAVATDVPAEQPGVATPAVTADPSEPVMVVTPETPGVCQAAPLPEVSVRPVDETDWVKGANPEEAEITLFEYSDFQCSGCAGMYPIIQDFLDVNTHVRLVYRHFPLDFHVHAEITAEAAEAAGAQGKFWEMHDLLFDRAGEWNALSAEDIRTRLSDYAEELGLDLEAFDAALDNHTYLDKIRSQYAEAAEMRLGGTPTFIFNNLLFPSDIGLSFQGLTAYLNILEQQDEIFYDAPPEATVGADDEIEAVLKTSKGDIRVHLLPASAPVHVNSFVFLAEEQWYNGSEFFFVRDNFVAVTGDPTNSTVGYPGYYCQGETQGVFDRAGLVGMLANGQFFVTLGSDAAQLNSQFALVGQVIEGLDILDELTRVLVGDPTALPADVLESVEIIDN